MVVQLEQTYSHAETTLPSRSDVRVTNDVGVVKFIEDAVSHRCSDSGFDLLMRDSLLEKGGREA